MSQFEIIRPENIFVANSQHTPKIKCVDYCSIQYQNRLLRFKGAKPLNRSTNLYKDGKTKGARKIVTNQQRQSRLSGILKARK